MTDLITAEEAEKLLDGPLLTGLANEHRALLLQAIGTDDADAMAYSKDGKPIRRVREITSPAKQAAEVIGNLARTVIDLHAQLADARADRDNCKVETTCWMNNASRLTDERDRLAAANAALEAKVAGLSDFIDDFAKAKIDALRYSPPYGSSPEDDPDPVVDAETVWAWQADAKAALATQEAGNAQSTPPISPEEAQFNAVRYHERFGPLDEHGNPLDPRRRG